MSRKPMEPGETRRRIIQAAVELMQELGSADKLTVRRIAARASVGIGLVNYHFRTKEHLVDEAVQGFIAEVIRSWPAHYFPRGGPGERLKTMLKGTARFLSEHPGVSRISMQHDLRRASGSDNTAQTIEAMLPVLREALGPSTRDGALRLVGLELVAPLQLAFLRKDVLREPAGFDFDDARQRDRFVEQLVDKVLDATRRKR